MNKPDQPKTDAELLASLAPADPSPWAPKPCFLRSTKIVLLDGKEYNFRALPATREVVAMLPALTGEGTGQDAFNALLRAIEISLGWEYPPSVVEGLLACGALPVGVREGEAGEVFKKIMAALVAQFG